ncbi:MAG TPA: carbohydrate kinase family protein [Anaerolineae bacterium]|nr:carbohydrate kinase family protein [Anaerolineae bacterium]
MALDVITLGPLNVDLFIKGSAPTNLDALTQWTGPSTVTLTTAGSTGYATLAFARLGMHTGVVSVLADDPLGELIYRDMVRAGVDVSHITRQPDTLSGIGIYLLLFGSQKRPLTYRYPTHFPWPKPLSQVDQNFLLSGRHIHCGGYLHYHEMWNDDLAQLYRGAQARGLTTSFDPQRILTHYPGAWIDPLREILKYTNLLLLDAYEATRLAVSEDLSTAALVLQQAGPRIVAIKNGAQGTLICTPDRTFHQPAGSVPEDQISDTVGAGDTFDAAFVTAFLSGWSVERCAGFAAAAAASSLRGPGAVSSLASREELERQLAIE